MKLVCLSDTHGYHNRIKVPDGDVLVFAGDMSQLGKAKEILLFSKWLDALPHKHKVIIPGNHDFLFENDWYNAKSLFSDDCILLNDSSTTIDGIKFHGHPCTPTFYNWAFNRDSGFPMRRHIDMIPLDTNVLISHGPPFEIFDWCPQGNHNKLQNVGCKQLKEKLKSLKELKLCVFGHIHEARNSGIIGGVTYANVSVCNDQYTEFREPMVFDI